MPLATRVTDLIGRTPLFELATTRSGTRLLLKLEQFNPTGAAKIRMAREMVSDAERQGLLSVGGHIIESTSGNTGLGLAVVAAERGYRFTAVVDHHASEDKLRAMRAMGAELVFVAEPGDDSLATSAREEHAAALAARVAGAYFTEQHENAANARGYYALADELLDEVPRVDILISAVGTGGSLFGTATRLRQRGSPPTVIGVEPVGSIAFGGTGGPYWQSGTGTPPGAVIGSAVDYSLLDAGVKVSDAAAFGTARAVAAELGLLLGGSAGGSVYAALTRLTDFPPGSSVVSIVCDGGEKYLDTVFNDDWMRAHDLLDPETEAEVTELLGRFIPPARHPRSRAPHPPPNADHRPPASPMHKPRPGLPHPARTDRPRTAATAYQNAALTSLAKPLPKAPGRTEGAAAGPPAWSRLAGSLLQRTPGAVALSSPPTPPVSADGPAQGFSVVQPSVPLGEPVPAPAAAGPDRRPDLREGSHPGAQTGSKAAGRDA